MNGVKEDLRRLKDYLEGVLTPLLDGEYLWVPRDELTALEMEVRRCMRCRLHKGRRKVVFGVGNPNADIMFVGEGPGEEEDKEGEPFVGRAGQLLTSIMESIGIRREDVYITNVLKCRPPGNRDPLPDEIQACKPYLLKQIELISPKVICALGNFAAQTILGVKVPISHLRGRVHTVSISGRKVGVVPTYHPAACLRAQSLSHMMVEDIKLILDRVALKEG